MDIHRCRFVPYPPSAINAIAVSHPLARSQRHQQEARLAVGRANGDIEIWNPLNGVWHQETILHGGKDRSIDGLVWVTEPDRDLGSGNVMVGRCRLFSIGYTTTVTEWDLENGRPKRHASGGHGDIWCLAAQPASRPSKGRANGSAAAEAAPGTKLVAGTIDGELVVYSIEDDDLAFERIIVRSPTKKAQMVSITFQSHGVVVVGCSDSSVRAYDVQKGQLLRKMTLGADLQGGSKDIIAWAVRCLPNGSIVSGDSTGHICIWDGRTYTLTQKMQSHKQDVLSLATSHDGSCIMSGGMDRRTVLLKKESGPGQRWGKVGGRKFHDHDVKAMASFEGGRMSVVVTGGPDASPVIVPLREFGREYHRRLPYLPQCPPITSACRARFIVSWWEREIHIWRLHRPFKDLFDAPKAGHGLDDNRKLLKTIVIKGESNITSATIDENGTLLVISTTVSVKAFRITHSDELRGADIKVSVMPLPQEISGTGAAKVQLSPDCNWLCLARDLEAIYVSRVGTDASNHSTISQPQKVRRLPRPIQKHVRLGGLGSYNRTVSHLAFSPDSRMLAAADIAGYVDTWVFVESGGKKANRTKARQEEDDALSADSSSESDDEDVGAGDAGERWIRNPNGKLLPKLASSPVVLSFSPRVPTSESPDYNLLAISAPWHLTVFEPLRGSLSRWSRQNKRLPDPIADTLDLARGALWQGERVWIYGPSLLCMLDLGQDVAPEAKPGGSHNGELQLAAEQQRRKRKRGVEDSGAGGRMNGKIETGRLAPRKVQRASHENWQDQTVWEDVDVDDAPRDEGWGSASEDDETESSKGALALRRQGEVESEDKSGSDGGKGRSWWLTFKYRPILGLVPLGVYDHGGDRREQMEVAVVERPPWDVNLPERYSNED